MITKTVFTVFFSSQEFLYFPNLSMLYLHKNNIEDLVEAYKLRKLTKLKTLTLNRNPMCNNSNYRTAIVHMLPELKKLDNVVVIRSERDLCKMPLSKDTQMRLLVAYPEDFDNGLKTAIWSHKLNVLIIYIIIMFHYTKCKFSIQ